MKLIFLDIDGVLNNQLWLTSDFRNHLPKLINGERNTKRWFDPRCVKLLNILTDKTGANIVVSSSWRKNRSLSELKRILYTNGVTGEIIGKTPQLYFKCSEEYNYSVPRGNEIKAWLEMNKGILNEKISKLKCVIFDDDSDMLYCQRHNYIRVDPYCGLTEGNIHRARIILS